MSASADRFYEFEGLERRRFAFEQVMRDRMREIAPRAWKVRAAFARAFNPPQAERDGLYPRLIARLGSEQAVDDAELRYRQIQSLSDSGEEISEPRMRGLLLLAEALGRPTEDELDALHDEAQAADTVHDIRRQLRRRIDARARG